MHRPRADLTSEGSSGHWNVKQAQFCSSDLKWLRNFCVKYHEPVVLLWNLFWGMLLSETMWPDNKLLTYAQRVGRKALRDNRETAPAAKRRTDVFVESKFVTPCRIAFRMTKTLLRCAAGISSLAQQKSEGCREIILLDCKWGVQ